MTYVVTVSMHLHAPSMHQLCTELCLSGNALIFVGIVLTEHDLKCLAKESYLIVYTPSRQQPIRWCHVVGSKDDVLRSLCTGV